MISKTARIQLTGDNSGYLELAQELSLPLNFGLGDIRDISQKTGAFSKSIVIPGTKNNKELLNHYYNVNVEAGTFDINKLQKCIVIGEDGSVLFDNGILQLTEINRDDKSFTQYDNLSFTLLVKDTAGDFFTAMSNKELTDLYFPVAPFLYLESSVTFSWGNDWQDYYKFLMPYIGADGLATDNLYSLAEFKPAIYARQYWDSIFASNGFTYTWDEIDDMMIQFSKKIIPYNGDVAKLNQNEIDKLSVIAETSGFQSLDLANLTPGGYIGGINEAFLLTPTYTDVNIDNELFDLQGAYDPSTTSWTAPFATAAPGQVNFRMDIDASLVIYNPNAYDIKLVYGIDALPLQLTCTNTFVNVGTGVKYSDDIYTTPTIPNNLVIASGAEYVCGAPFIASSSNSFSNINITDNFDGKIGLKTSPYSGIVQWDDNTLGSVAPAASVIYRIKINSIKLTISPNSDVAAAYGTIIDINNYIPKKIKQSDFIKSICQIYNLFIYPDQNNPSNLIIKNRDEFYNEGQTINLSSKFIKNMPQILRFLPDVSAKKLVLTYKQDNDGHNIAYFNATNEVCGQLEYESQSEYVKNKEVKEIIFSPTPLDQTTFGAILPAINGLAPKNNIRILHDGGMLPCSDFYIQENASNSPTLFNNYPYMGHFDNPINPQVDFNFGTCDYYFYNINPVTKNNLFNNFWRRTYNQINNGRMLTAYFDLDNEFISNLKLNYKIYLEQYESYWFINKIIDYNGNNHVPTKVELISADGDILIKPRSSEPVIVLPGSPIRTPIINRVKDRFSGLNTDLSSTGKITGIFNHITKDSFNTTIGGNSNYIDAANVTIINTDNQVVVTPNIIIDNNTVTDITNLTLSDVLTNGNTTGANDIIVDDSQKITNTLGKVYQEFIATGFEQRTTDDLVSPTIINLFQNFLGYIALQVTNATAGNFSRIQMANTQLDIIASGIGGATLTEISMTDDEILMKNQLEDLITLNEDGLLIDKRYTPSSSLDTTGSQGQVTIDDNYVYVKTSTGWKRSLLLTF